MEDQEILHLFRSPEIPRRPLGITVNDRSGLAGVAYWVNTTMGLKGSRQLAKDDPAIVAIHAEVERQYRGGRTTGFSPDEMLALSRRHLGAVTNARDRSK